MELDVEKLRVTLIQTFNKILEAPDTFIEACESDNTIDQIHNCENYTNMLIASCIISE